MSTTARSGSTIGSRTGERADKFIEVLQINIIVRVIVKALARRASRLAGLEAALKPGKIGQALASVGKPLYRFTPDRNLTFRVIASWKGVTGTDVGLVTEAGGSFATCGFFGVIGGEYLLYARKDPDSDKLRVKLCTFRQGESAEIETAALDAITTRLQLVTGDDPISPPEEIRFALCGLGTVMALSVSLLFLVTQRCHSVRRQ